jgi:hypothetical protein
MLAKLHHMLISGQPIPRTFTTAFSSLPVSRPWIWLSTWAVVRNCCNFCTALDISVLPTYDVNHMSCKGFWTRTRLASMNSVLKAGPMRLAVTEGYPYTEGYPRILKRSIVRLTDLGHLPCVCLHRCALVFEHQIGGLGDIERSIVRIQGDPQDIHVFDSSESVLGRDWPSNRRTCQEVQACYRRGPKPRPAFPNATA